MDLCARSETSFYLSFHGMDVKVEETLRARFSFAASLSIGVSYRPLISSRLISLVEIYGIGDISVLPLSTPHTYVGATPRRGVKPDRPVRYSTNPGRVTFISRI